MQIINGKEIAAEILGELKSLPKPKKFLAGVLVGDNPASLNFLKQKEKTAKELDVDFRLYKFPTDLKNDDLRNDVGKIANHKTCGGIVLQLPLPEHLNRHYILNVIPREKDVDVLGERALGAFYAGRNPVLPPAVGTVEIVCQVSGIRYQDAKVAIVGPGLLIGRPVMLWLADKAKEIYVMGKQSDLGMLQYADIVVSGVGKAGLIKPAMLKPGAGVIDFGYSNVEGKISGDFDTSLPTTSYQLLNFYTPTPGGTGPILVAKLLENFYKLNLEKKEDTAALRP